VNDQELTSARDRALSQLKRYALPSGALMGDEAIHDGPAPDIGYEYCTLTELLFSLSSAVQKSGDRDFGDWLEDIAFNAGQGARLADGTGLAYLSADTRLAAVASRGDHYSPDQPGRRFKYSPTHEDVACCCNPNAVRFMPHYVSGLWMKLTDRAGVAAVTYGPCVLITTINGVKVTLEETTNYPFDNEIVFAIKPEREVHFAFWLRRPHWALATVQADGAAWTGHAGWICLEKTWSTHETVILRFGTDVKFVPYPNGQVAVRYGALQFALPIESERHSLKDYAVTGFHDYDIVPQGDTPIDEAPEIDRDGWQIEIDPAFDQLHPWDQAAVRLRQGSITLVPLGCTVLRHAAFILKEGQT
ncbi:MAG: glycoside hydrolase family 127 protein, partial [Anaerolineae bacterium]